MVVVAPGSEPGHPGAENAEAQTKGTAQEPSASPTEFEINAEPVAAHDAKASILEPAQTASPLVPPVDMPAYAEFQVSAQEIPTETHADEIAAPEEISFPEPVAEAPAPPAEEKVPELAAVEQSHTPAKPSEPESEFE